MKENPLGPENGRLGDWRQKQSEGGTVNDEVCVSKAYKRARIERET